jgi:zona occludens toxin
MTAAEYVDSRTPRLKDFAHTAPAYDDVTKPTEAPYPAACVQMGKTCKCYTQQATLLQVSGAVCLQIVQQGFFMDWKTAQRGEFIPRDRGDYRHQREPLPQAQQVAQMDPVRAVPAPMPPARPEPPQSQYLQGLAARNAQVRSSLQ